MARGNGVLGNVLIIILVIYVAYVLLTSLSQSTPGFQSYAALLVTAVVGAGAVGLRRAFR